MSLIALLPLYFLIHPLHLSITEMEYNATNNSFELIHKIFVDDLEDAIFASEKVRLFIGTPKEHPNAEKYISQYIEKNYKINSSNKLTANWIGYTFKDVQTLWVFREITNLPANGQGQIKCTFLFEHFPDQKNIIYYKHPQYSKQTFVFNAGNYDIFDLKW